METPAELRTLIGADGRLKRLPVKLSRKETLARWLLELLEFNREYTEREVNDIFLTVVDDFALIRRMLVEMHLLERDSYGRVYKRVVQA